MKSVEESLAEEKKRSEAQLQKMLRARQKKKVAGRIKDLNKEENKLDEQIESVNLEIGARKAEVYAKEGSATALVDQTIQNKKDQIAKSLQKKFARFDDALN